MSKSNLKRNTAKGARQALRGLGGAQVGGTLGSWGSDLIIGENDSPEEAARKKGILTLSSALAGGAHGLSQTEDNPALGRMYSGFGGGSLGSRLSNIPGFKSVGGWLGLQVVLKLINI